MKEGIPTSVEVYPPIPNVVRHVKERPKAYVERQYEVVFRDDAGRLTVYKADMGKEGPLSPAVAVRQLLPSGESAKLAEFSIGFGGFTAEIAHGHLEDVLEVNRRIAETYEYPPEDFFSGVLIGQFSIYGEKFRIYHSVTGDRERFQGTVREGETFSAPNLEHEYIVSRGEKSRQFTRISLSDGNTWILTLPLDFNPDELAREISGNSETWPFLDKTFPVTLQTD